MRVIEPGVTETRIDCHNCKAKLSYGHKDVQKMYDDILNETFYYVECPLCKTKMFIKDWLVS